MLAAGVLLIPALAAAQQVLEEKKQKPAAKAAPAKPAARGGTVATVNGVAVPQARADFLMQQQQQALGYYKPVQSMYQSAYGKGLQTQGQTGTRKVGM